jgi:hypothetical protein
MVNYEKSLWCDGCGVEISWSPVIAGETKYCCQDCQNGYECDCKNLISVENSYDYANSDQKSKYEGF